MSETIPQALPMKPPKGGVVVRMYCVGLGDCFLLAFPGKGKKTFHVLVDCGVMKGTDGAADRMKMAMEHIGKTVGKDGIDLLVVTHPHWDHACGFGMAKDAFAAIPIHKVWMAWTEEPGVPNTLGLAQWRRETLRAASTTAALAAGDGSDTQLNRATRNLLRFAGCTPPGDAQAMAEDELIARNLGLATGGQIHAGNLELAAGPTTEDLMQAVRGRVRKVEYKKPSCEPVVLPDLPGVQIHVLGPPTDLKWLGKDDPSKRDSEVYLNGLASLMAAAGAGMADGNSSDADSDLRDLSYPFAWYYRIRTSDLQCRPEHTCFLCKHYVENTEETWRRIDQDWLGASATLALKLDQHVNNTSLALAFELGDGPDAPVLLFPGDAQVGNWLSWHQRQGNGPKAADLLARTVFYKVGHHGSHNATLKDQGLKLIPASKRFAAMIPVDKARARELDWEMPYPPLLEDLVARTGGRVAQADDGFPQAGKNAEFVAQNLNGKPFCIERLVRR